MREIDINEERVLRAACESLALEDLEAVERELAGDRALARAAGAAYKAHKKRALRIIRRGTDKRTRLAPVLLRSAACALVLLAVGYALLSQRPAVDRQLASPEPLVTFAPVATAEPSAVPTASWTPSPTVAPTATPTIAPTATPTIAPTATPTVAPTATPVPVSVVPGEWTGEYYPGYIPEGYALTKVAQSEASMTAQYRTADGKTLSFTQYLDGARPEISPEGMTFSYISLQDDVALAMTGNGQYTVTWVKGGAALSLTLDETEPESLCILESVYNLSAP